MALAQIGTGTVDFDNRTDIILPPVALDRNDGHAFWLEADPPAATTRAGYLNVYFLMDTAEGTFTTPLVTKWFPNGFPMLFYFGVPRTFIANNLPCRMLLQPKEFSPGLEQVRTFNVMAGWDNEGRADASGISYPVGG